MANRLQKKSPRDGGRGFLRLLPRFLFRRVRSRNFFFSGFLSLGHRFLVQLGLLFSSVITFRDFFFSGFFFLGHRSLLQLRLIFGQVVIFGSFCGCSPLGLLREGGIGVRFRRVLWFPTADLSEASGFILGKGGAAGFSTAGRVLLTCSAARSQTRRQR